jgi:hypothetical protein
MQQKTKKDSTCSENVLDGVVHIIELEENHPVLKQHNECITSSLVSLIESLSSAEITCRLERADIQRGDYRAYSQAKQEIFKGMFINTDIYDRQIKTVIRYVETIPMKRQARQRNAI